jgi:hypothetical protein
MSAPSDSPNTAVAVTRIPGTRRVTLPMTSQFPLRVTSFSSGRVNIFTIFSERVYLPPKTTRYSWFGTTSPGTSASTCVSACSCASPRSCYARAEEAVPRRHHRFQAITVEGTLTSRRVSLHPASLPRGGPSAAATFNVNSPAPVITAISPRIVPPGAAATITITGTGFESNSAVQWNGFARPGNQAITRQPLR